MLLFFVISWICLVSCVKGLTCDKGHESELTPQCHEFVSSIAHRTSGMPCRQKAEKKQNKKTLERQTLSEEEYDEKETEWMLYLENKTKSLQKSKEWAQKEIHQRAFSVCCFFKLAWNFSRLTEVLITYNLHLDDNKSREFELSVVPTTTSQLQQM